MNNKVLFSSVQDVTSPVENETSTSSYMFYGFTNQQFKSHLIAMMNILIKTLKKQRLRESESEVFHHFIHQLT